MNKDTYTYGLLQYHHSQLLGEVLNIGLIVYFPIHKHFAFLYPKKLIRLRFAYSVIPEKTIKSYFQYFSNRVSQLNASPNLFSNYNVDKSLETFIEREFLPSDSSALQFGGYRTSILYTSNIDHIKDQLYNLYFSVFQYQEGITKRIDESHLLSKYRKYLKQYNGENFNIATDRRFQQDYAVEPHPATVVKFDVAWRSKDALHLVKPISFDLSRQDTITKKAYQYYGQFLDLENLAIENKYNFDVLLAKPRNRNLFKTYDNAIRLLEKPKRVNLIDPSSLDSYSKSSAELASVDLIT